MAGRDAQRCVFEACAEELVSAAGAVVGGTIVRGTVWMKLLMPAALEEGGGITGLVFCV